MFTVLHTERLLLRRLKESDSINLFEIRSDDCVNKYIDRPAPADTSAVKEFIIARNKDIDAEKCCYWAIALKNKPDLIIGTVCLWNFSPDKKTAEIGYELHPGYQGEGLMDEAVKRVISFAKSSGFNLLEAVTHKLNKSSLNLLGKNGFILIGKFENSPDQKVYLKKLAD